MTQPEKTRKSKTRMAASTPSPEPSPVAPSDWQAAGNAIAKSWSQYETVRENGESDAEKGKPQEEA